jgi:hypothetical protein
MVKAFRDVMAKIAVIGQDTSKMIDCSMMIPEPDDWAVLIPPPENQLPLGH